MDSHQSHFKLLEMSFFHFVLMITCKDHKIILKIFHLSYSNNWAFKSLSAIPIMRVSNTAIGLVFFRHFLDFLYWKLKTGNLCCSLDIIQFLSMQKLIGFYVPPFLWRVISNQICSDNIMWYAMAYTLQKTFLAPFFFQFHNVIKTFGASPWISDSLVSQLWVALRIPVNCFT